MDDELDCRPVQESVARRIDTRMARVSAVLVAVLAVGFLAFGIFQLLHGEILDAVGPLLVAVLGGVAVFILSDVKRDIRTQRTARRVALAIVPFALLANLIQLVP
ncbi:hypothetical protein AB0I24_15420 [Brachybacterium paraconglomeratum]